MRILATGGAAFIASHVADAYFAAWHDVAILDDLSRGSLGRHFRQAAGHTSAPEASLPSARVPRA